MVSFSYLIALISPFLLPVHCIVMCGPHYSIKSSFEKRGYLLGRFFSYSVLGGLFGYFGQGLYAFLGYEALKLIAFIVFLMISILIFLSWFGHSFQIFPKQILTYFRQFRLPAFIQGLLSIALPCSVIYQMIGLSVLTKSFYGGLLVGSIYSFLTGFLLWLSAGFASKIKYKLNEFRVFFRVIISILILISLTQFFNKAFQPLNEENIIQKEILCL